MTATALGGRKSRDGLRPLNPLRDLGQLADLMQEAFGEDLGAEGRAALSDLRLFSYLGPFLWLFSAISYEFRQFFSGIVWVEDGKLIGNATVNRRNPYSTRWMISNVAVRASHRGRGIAHQLVEAAIKHAREHGGETIELQVRADNVPARHLYEHMGFQQIAGTTDLRLGRVDPVAPLSLPGFSLRRWRPADSWPEYELVTTATPAAVREVSPVRWQDFQRGFEQRFSAWLGDVLAGRRVHRLVGEKDGKLVATLTVRIQHFGWAHSLHMVVHPDCRGQLEKVLVSHALATLRRAPRRPVVARLPSYHPQAIAALKDYGFVEKNTLLSMRLELR